jgi:hypothetical protein
MIYEAIKGILFLIAYIVVKREVVSRNADQILSGSLLSGLG